MSPINTSYLNHAKSIAFPSMFTVALTATAVPNSATSGAGVPVGQAESSFSVPARLIPLGTGAVALRANDLLVVGPDSALSSGLAYSAYAVPTTNTVTLRFTNASFSTVTQRAGTWAFGYFGIMP